MLDLLIYIAPTGALALALWLFRNAIATRLTKSVQHEYDKKLASVNADLRKTEELLRSDIREREREIDALRSGALAGMISRQTAVDKRRLEAIDQLWSGVLAMGSVKGATALMSVLKFDYALKQSSENPRAKQMFQSMAAPFDPTKLNTGDALKARPYVSPMAWALFSAYTAIHGLAVTQLYLLKSGLNMPDVIDMEVIKKLVKTALPQYAEYVDKNGSASCYQLLDELEKGILNEISSMLSGRDFDKDSVERAAAIMEAANGVSSTFQKPSVAPEGGADVIVLS